MSKPEDYEQPEHLVDVKRPWEAGFCEEEASQKADARARKGDDPEAIKTAELNRVLEQDRKFRQMQKDKG